MAFQWLIVILGNAATENVKFNDNRAPCCGFRWNEVITNNVWGEGRA
jgi:hypothetical protein